MPSFCLATWNVNSVRQRIEHLQTWLKDTAPDVVCLQEIKCLDDAFPRLEIEALGYQVETFGQKTFNGVALLSKYRLEDITRGLGGDPSDEQSRFIEATLSLPSGHAVTVASIYAPNGNPLGTEKFPYKLKFLDRLRAHAKELLAEERIFLLAGDYNIIPTPDDAKNPDLWKNDALFQPESKAKWREFLALGLTDAVRACDASSDLYTFWDYQAGAFQKNNGIRIDHIALSPSAADHLDTIAIDKFVRAWDKPSDHVPVRAIFSF